jgi:hypothetical protein
MVLWLVYLVFALIFGISMRRPLGALVEAGRQRANLRREMKALSGAVAPEAMPHLSRTLGRMLEDTRMLRIALAEPIQAARAWHSADGSPLLGHVDVGDGSDLDRCDEVDIALVDARRAVWDWVRTVEALPGDDQRTLEGLGLTTGLARDLLSGRNAFQRISRVPKRELDRIEQQLQPLLASLERFEAGLQAPRTAIYR